MPSDRAGWRRASPFGIDNTRRRNQTFTGRTGKETTSAPNLVGSGRTVTRHGPCPVGSHPGSAMGSRLPTGPSARQQAQSSAAPTVRPTAACSARSSAASPGPVVEAWSPYRTGNADRWTARQLVRAKGGASVSVVIPARDEEATVGAIVSTIHQHLMRRLPLVDELIVVDSRSRDRTAE